MEPAAHPFPQRTGREVTPVVVVSQCLGFAPVRYDGQVLRDAFVQTLQGHVHFVPVCPEVGIGLGVPRDPIRIVVDESERRLIQPAKALDLTAAMTQFSRELLAGFHVVDGFILKSRSPSCGIDDVKTFLGNGQPGSMGAGFFAAEVLRQFPHAAVVDEARLGTPAFRHLFLIRLFAAARLREIAANGAAADLVDFHTRYKLQWMAFSHDGLRALGQLVANAGRQTWGETLEHYRARVASMTREPARVGSVCNALQHAFGYVSDRLSGAEKKDFATLLEDFRQGRRPLSEVLHALHTWAVRFEQRYLMGQRFFEPYPTALMDAADDRKASS